MSPRPGPRRPQVAIRVSESGIQAIDDLADQAGVTRSEMVRRLLSAAVADPGIRNSPPRACSASSTTAASSPTSSSLSATSTRTDGSG